jgi:FolB domain-containing protein
MDKIIIKDLHVTGIIGIYDYERVTPQEMMINIILYTDIREAAKNDDFSKCVDYEMVSNMVKTHAQTSKRLIVEALAEDLANLCLDVPRVQKVNIRVEKIQTLPFIASVGVEIEREKAEE